MNIGKSIKLALVMRKMTQRELAARMGRHHVYICKLCNAERAGMLAVESVAAALDMRVSELIELGERE